MVSHFSWMVLGKRGERVCCLLVLNLVSSTLSCIHQPRPRLVKLDILCGLAAIRNWSQDWGDFFAQAMHAFAGPSRFQYEIQLEKSPQSWEFSRYSQVQSQDTSIVPWCVFYYCRTYYKAVRVGGEESGGHVL